MHLKSKEGWLYPSEQGDSSILCGDCCQFFFLLSFLECSPQLRGGVSEEFIVFGKLFECPYCSFVVICSFLMYCNSFEIIIFCLSSCFLSLIKGFDQVFMSFSERFYFLCLSLVSLIDSEDTIRNWVIECHPPISDRIKCSITCDLKL